MSLDKRHFSPNKSDRQIKQWFHPLYRMESPSKKEFERIECLLDEVSVDVVNGLTFSEILLHLEQGGRYEHQKKPLSHQTAVQYVEAVKSRMALDRNRDHDQVKDVLYSQYLNLYREALEQNNIITAKQVLDSLVKLYGFDKAPAAAVQINTDKEQVNINFNTGNDNGS